MYMDVSGQNYIYDRDNQIVYDIFFSSPRIVRCRAFLKAWYLPGNSMEIQGDND